MQSCPPPPRRSSRRHSSSHSLIYPLGAQFRHTGNPVITENKVPATHVYIHSGNTTVRPTLPQRGHTITGNFQCRPEIIRHDGALNGFVLAPKEKLGRYNKQLLRECEQCQQDDLRERQHRIDQQLQEIQEQEMRIHHAQTQMNRLSESLKMQAKKLDDVQSTLQTRVAYLETMQLGPGTTDDLAHVDESYEKENEAVFTPTSISTTTTTTTTTTAATSRDCKPHVEGAPHNGNILLVTAHMRGGDMCCTICSNCPIKHIRSLLDELLAFDRRHAWIRPGVVRMDSPPYAGAREVYRVTNSDLDALATTLLDAAVLKDMGVMLKAKLSTTQLLVARGVLTAAFFTLVAGCGIAGWAGGVGRGSERHRGGAQAYMWLTNVSMSIVAGFLGTVFLWAWTRI